MLFLFWNTKRVLRQILKRIDRPHILASHRCETFQKLLHIDIAQVRRTFLGILLSKNER